MKEEEVKEAIYSQNLSETIDQETNKLLRIKFKIGPRDKHTVHYVVEVTASIRKALLIKDNIYIGFTSGNTKDYLVVPRFLKYQDL